jgi:hypothetical protein
MEPDITDVQAVEALPHELIGGMANLPALMISLAVLKGTARADAEQIVSLLPNALQVAPCFLDRLRAKWRYAFGFPLSGLPDGKVILGTHMFHEVERLFEVVRCARQKLAPTELEAYLASIANRSNHEDMVFEFAPILRLSESVNVSYEVNAAGRGTVDWRIGLPEGPAILLEVKNRVKDLFEGLSQISEATEVAHEPVHDSNLLFRNIEKKFGNYKVSGDIHAAWIKTAIRQEEDELQTAFKGLDANRLQVAILGDWGDDAYVLANDPTAKEIVLNLFRITESRRFVFRRGIPVSS